MSNLTAFLAQNKIKKPNVKFVASTSFIDEDGKPIEWEIKAITSQENDDIKKLQSSVPTILAEYGKTPLIEPPKSAFYPSDQVNFKLGTAVASLNKKKIIGYYADKIHTKADTVFDENNMAALVHIYSKWCLENPENQS